MVEPIITTGAVLVGAGAWFCDKIFGPSAEALGDTLKVYVNSRISGIFDRANNLVIESGVEPAPIMPGLISRMVVDASFSEDNDEITDWWANLFVDASISGSNKHAVFSDMMAFLGVAEASVLKEFITTFENGKLPASFVFNNADGAGIDVMREGWILNILGNPPFQQSRLDKLRLSMEVGSLDWPIRYTSWKIPVRQDVGDTIFDTGVNPWYSLNREPLAILQRAGILREAMVQGAVWGGDYNIRTIEVTPFGADFYNVCTSRSSQQ